MNRPGPDQPHGMAHEDHHPGPAGERPEDDLDLRHLLRQAVDGIEPAPHALERLRQAVPARRTRRRQAMVGAAAGVLLIGTAVPAVVHATGADDTPVTTAAAASGPRARTTGPGGPGPAEQGATGGGPVGPAGGVLPSAGGSAPASPAPSSGAPDAQPGKSRPPAATMAATSPTCTAPQLGKGSAQTGSPDRAGRIRGAFRVVNVSDLSCTVGGGGEITVTAQGAADPTKVQVVDHTAGDPATDLPDPATAPDSLILPPGKAYQVQFEWVPSNCASSPPPASGGSGDHNTPGTTTGDTPAQHPDTPADGTTTAPPAPTAAVTLAHIPDGSTQPAATTTLPTPCAGTLYRTPPLPTP
ncbi:anti-sigma factor [Streptantibioticus cattleyicolor]|uniref:DUF4232 domain-containing protein n=1 Tax=Streptantibioticus cattleyicolor (strain ATCC 35852 / DSM 46488 / JCM 4925 / NBRC 14057 / NRRL 8057) TaxID=1003195 RepID=G8WS63_STREN|nr:hypothetical protein [Streptantibioticus cattleyicolor]AEW95303.1 hypothetical protein SCATT_29320 [Streptantibioticus cattleyicolor NRRL 8057 = DSM 46488]